ncbi:hypothetical protein [Mucilaginibacter sp. UYCu711]|uniref:hypothetical protein n=1 Tax=Mucilaginibacter sp. UYCu711 TaxID=3156339 RepID=UPI003D1A789C
MIYINDGSYRPDPKKYIALADSLNKKLKLNDQDTTSAYYRALLYLNFNDLKSVPFPGDKTAFTNLVVAKVLADRAISLKMKNINLKIVRAQICKELAYRYSGDESWKYNTKQIADRRAQFNSYKELANKYYTELAELDKPNAYDYDKLRVNYNYPL